MYLALAPTAKHLGQARQQVRRRARDDARVGTAAHDRVRLAAARLAVRQHRARQARRHLVCSIVSVAWARWRYRGVVKVCVTVTRRPRLAPSAHAPRQLPHAHAPTMPRTAASNSAALSVPGANTRSKPNVSVVPRLASLTATVPSSGATVTQPGPPPSARTGGRRRTKTSTLDRPTSASAALRTLTVRLPVRAAAATAERGRADNVDGGGGSGAGSRSTTSRDNNWRGAASPTAGTLALRPTAALAGRIPPRPAGEVRLSADNVKMGTTKVAAAWQVRQSNHKQIM